MNNNYTIIIAYSLFVALATLCHPAFLARNHFLDDFAGSDLLSLLAVILSITFASVANIHLALNQFVRRAFGKDLERGAKVARALRSDINENAWFLFYAFIVAVCSLLVKETLPDNDYLRSAMNGLALGTLLANILVFRDIYCTVFELAVSEISVKAAPPPDYDPEVSVAAND